MAAQDFALLPLDELSSNTVVMLMGLISHNFLSGVPKAAVLPLRERAYQAIRGWIILGRWKIGDPLSEQQLAEELEISRTPVREALQALAREGFVEVQPSRGTFVSGLSQEDLREIYELREALEGETARLAATHASDQDIDELARIIRQANDRLDALRAMETSDLGYEKTLSQLDYRHRAGTEFHDALARIACNRRIREMLSNLEATTIRTRLTYGAFQRPHDIWEEHATILAAIRSRDPEEAERSIRRHLHSAYEFLAGQAQLAKVGGSPTDVQVPNPGVVSSKDIAGP